MFSRLKKISFQDCRYLPVGFTAGRSPYRLRERRTAHLPKPDYEVSSYRVVNEVSSVVADSFADDLCVVIGDVGTENWGGGHVGGYGSRAFFDLNKNNVMYAKNVHERLQPASLTKIMTALVALKYGKS